MEISPTLADLARATVLPQPARYSWPLRCPMRTFAGEALDVLAACMLFPAVVEADSHRLVIESPADACACLSAYMKVIDGWCTRLGSFTPGACPLPTRVHFIEEAGFAPSSLTTGARPHCS